MCCPHPHAGHVSSQLYAITVALAAQPTPEHLLVQKMVLKIFYRAVEVVAALLGK